jgi:gliding motility-associated-like protein
MMKKILQSLTYLFCSVILFNSNSYAKNGLNTVVENSFLKKGILSLVFAPPTVTSPVYYCQNSPAVPLTATPSAGATLNWYGTDATGGTASSTAPTPSTATVGTTSYFVSETLGGLESTRSRIDVIVVADNGAQILNFRCDPSQVLPADRNSSVMFDWSNNPLISNTYNYIYTIQGQAPVSGSTGVSHQQVFGMSPGQSATLTLSSATHPCVPPQTITCSVPCGTSTVTPNFPAIAPFCSGTTPPILGSTSPNGITGTWSPAIVSNTASGSYVFTPNPVLFPCATTQTLNVTVTPLATPTFATVPATVCQNSAPITLPLSSSNVTPITGNWSPATVNTAVLGPSNYVFTPNPGQCVASPTTTITITVNPNITPTFTQVPPICSGTALSALPTTSTNNITGAWSPALNNTTTTTYTFTPTAGQCATTTAMTITVTPNATPTFNAVPAICAGDPLSPLPTTSTNGYTGSWFPGLDNTATATYTFTPNTGQCATTTTLTIMVNPLKTPVFTTVPDFVCENEVVPALPTSSSNVPAITGTWSPPTVDTSVLGASDYVFTPNAGQCAISITQTITVNPSNTLVDFTWSVTEAFSKNQVITITASGPGDYLYQLDDGPFQESPVFEQVAAGYHSVTVKDVMGCSSSITKTDILVIDYPRFFTPNNDGYNDAWNIFTLENALGSKIRIFDRYGKLLKEISPNGTGWDGSYNGHPLPATDYWFVVDYAESGLVKQFKSHFSLKR